MADPHHYLVTGFPGFIARRLVPALLRQYPGNDVSVLVQPAFEAAAKEEISHYGADTARVTIVAGDLADMHLGLSSKEYRELTDKVTDIFHLAALAKHESQVKAMRLVNVDGTRNMLELAADSPRLKRFHYMSTSVVSGTRVGVIEEDELDEGQSFRSPYEQTKFEAEKLVRSAARTLPVTIFRPGIVVGDSRTGEIDRFEGPYYVAILLVMSPLGVSLPMPGSAVAPLNAVPVDFVVDATIRIAHDPRSLGRTFHLVDPNPISARKAYELVAAKMGKKMPRITTPYRLVDKVLQVPGLERMVRQQRAALAAVNHLALYSCANTLELLDGTGIRCPRFPTYLDRLVDFAQDHFRKNKQPTVEDALR